ncbi:MAG: ABC transporter substrate-binding protein, partial [Desulfobacterales bacterium]|nr:ABC transporter substrate-binding protein [Desulfobacterales bacterium]
MRKIVTSLLLLTLFLIAGWAFAGSKIIIDRSGNQIVVRKSFTRIISLYGAHTEN